MLLCRIFSPRERGQQRTLEQGPPPVLLPSHHRISHADPQHDRSQRSRWRKGSVPFRSGSALFLAAKDKKRADIAAAQAAFAAFEEGDSAYAIKSLETLARRLYSSDVRAALAAAYYRSGDAARAEDAWLGLCELRDAQCGKYNDTEWLLEYRRWTPALARAMQDFLAMR